MNSACLRQIVYSTVDLQKNVEGRIGDDSINFFHGVQFLQKGITLRECGRPSCWMVEPSSLARSIQNPTSPAIALVQVTQQAQSLGNKLDEQEGVRSRPPQVPNPRSRLAWALGLRLIGHFPSPCQGRSLIGRDRAISAWNLSPITLPD
jgi:hypothetical protein